LISLFYIDLDLVPDIEFPELAVVTYFPEASPEEVKTLISIPMEQTALALGGVKSVNSVSRDGISVLKIRYRWGEDLSIAHMELREKLDLLKSFLPKEAKRPLIIHREASGNAFSGVSVVSNSIDARSLYLMCRKDIMPFLEKTDGVAGVDILGGERPEVKVIVDPEKLVKYNISVGEIRDALVSSNKDFPVGLFKTIQNEYIVRLDGSVKDYRDLEGIVLKEEDKKLVFLGDVASVFYGTEEKENAVFIDGEDALMLSIRKQPGFNIIKVSGEIERKVGLLNERYSGRVSFYKTFDESIQIKESLKNLTLAMALGILFTVISVYFFFSNLKASLLIIATVPLSIIGTFIIMKVARQSINLLTLSGFSLAIGMIVDNSVIVVYAVYGLLYRDKKVYDGDKEARFFNGIKKVVPAVFSATLTTVVVFLPVLFLKGILKQIFLQMSIVIVTSLLFSLLFAITLVPVFLSRLKIKKKKTALLFGTGDLFATLYKKALGFVIMRKPVFSCILAAAFLSGIFSYGLLDKRFIESVPKDHFFIKMFIKKQVPFEYTARVAEHIYSIINRDKRISNVIVSIGIDTDDTASNIDGIYGVNTAVFKIYTEETGESMYSLISSIRKSITAFSGVDFIFTVPDNAVQKLLLRSDFDAVIKIYDSSPDYLAGKVNEVHNYLSELDITEDVLSSYYMSNSESSFLLNRKEMALYGIDARGLGEFISAAVSGLMAGVWKKDEHEIPVVLRFSKGSFSELKALLRYSVKNSKGKRIDLGEVLSLREAPAPNIIMREDQKTFARVEFNLKQAGEKKRDFSFLFGRKNPIALYFESMGTEYEYIDQFSLLRENYFELMLALFLALFLEYVILASGFKSFSKPVLVIAMVPLSIPGIFLILFLINASLNINTFMSIIVLTGLLVNNAIMLFLEYQERDVSSVKELVDASLKRLKPIMITTSSTILALIPTLFTNNMIQTSLAATLILGLIYSTIITLFYLPMFYTIFYLRGPERYGKPFI
jgi:multidrug efflux pump subunit AcrB